MGQRNFIRVIQHGYPHESGDGIVYTGSSHDRRCCILRREFFFDNEDPRQVEEALGKARKLLGELRENNSRGRARLVSFLAIPGHPSLPRVGFNAEAHWSEAA